jgi:DNA end-binding protein Ku
MPHEPFGQEAFAVVREVMRNRGMAALGRLVLAKRERVVALEPYGKGLLATTLRYPYEVRDANECFNELPELVLAPDVMSLAERILDSKVAGFDPGTFHDRYEEALLAHLKAKAAGAAPAPKPSFAMPRRVINLMETLRRSMADVQNSGGAKHAGRARKWA